MTNDLGKHILIVAHMSHREVAGRKPDPSRL